MTPGRVVVAGAVARNLDAGGHVWAMLHWALGFRALGWHVVFLDRLDPEPGLRDRPVVRRLDAIMREMGLGDHYSLELDPDERPVGLDRGQVLEALRDADLLLNIMGYLDDPELLDAARHRVFLDIDPGFGQMWWDLGLCDPFLGHHRFVTVGTGVGRVDCTIPTCERDWVRTLPPVQLDLWSPGSAPGERYSSVGAWRGPYDAIELDGVRYGLRAHEFRRFADLPTRTGGRLEVALDIADADDADAERLRRGGWVLVDPRRVAGDPASYRRYVSTSRGEFGVAKEIYVKSRSGWFSDRTACYLAAGRPAIVQDTGLDPALPRGEGLLTFSDPEDAAGALERVEARWEEHSRAARDWADAHLDARRVVDRMVGRVAA